MASWSIPITEITHAYSEKIKPISIFHGKNAEVTILKKEIITLL